MFYIGGTYSFSEWKDGRNSLWEIRSGGKLYINHSSWSNPMEHQLCSAPDDVEIVKLIEFELEMRKLLNE
jgi:hypothetical protein